MKMSTIASRDVFDRALEAALKAGAQTGVDGLASIPDLGLQGQLEEAWGAIESALKSGFQYGRAKAQALFESAVEKTERLLEEAGYKAQELQRLLLARMQAFIQTYVQGALARIPASIIVSEAKYVVASVTCTQKIILAGSIKSNLTELFELTVNGELEVAVEYSTLQAMTAKA